MGRCLHCDVLKAVEDFKADHPDMTMLEAVEMVLVAVVDIAGIDVEDTPDYEHRVDDVYTALDRLFASAADPTAKPTIN